MKSSINTARAASNVILMVPSKKSPARTSTTTRVNHLWTAMLDLNAAPRGTEEQDAIAYRIPIDMVSEMREMLAIAHENDVPLFDDYYDARDFVCACVYGPDLTSAEVAALEARFAAKTAALAANTIALAEARAQLKEFEDLLAEIARLEALPLRTS